MAPDRKSVTFQLRPEAKFADGSPLTADDVVFSFDTLKGRATRTSRCRCATSTKAEALDAHTVRYTFTGDLMRDLPLVVAELPILSKAYYATHRLRSDDARAAARLGPYEIGDFKAGTYVSYKRRPDYWAKDLPVNRGRFNFDELRYEYFRDRTDRAGEPQGRRRSTCARSSPRSTGRPATNVPRSRMAGYQRSTLPDERPSGAQGFFLNTRREQFADIRVRKALDYAFDFEWSNKNLFYEPLHAHAELLRELADEGDRSSRARKNWRCSSRSATSYRQRCSASPTAAGDRRLGPRPR